MADKTVFSRYSKAFLDNDSKFSGEEFGSICWKISIEEWENGSRYSDHSVRFADCSRSISLDLTASSLEEYDLRIKKVEEIERSLARLKSALNDAKEFTRKNPEKKKKSKKND